MQGHGRIIAPDFCVAHREANSGLSTLNRTKSILSIYHQQRQLQKQRGMCLNDTYPFCQQPLSGNCHSICFSKPVLWTAAACVSFFYDSEPVPQKNAAHAGSYFTGLISSILSIVNPVRNLEYMSGIIRYAIGVISVFPFMGLTSRFAFTPLML